MIIYTTDSLFAWNRLTDSPQLLSIRKFFGLGEADEVLARDDVAITDVLELDQELQAAPEGRHPLTSPPQHASMPSAFRKRINASPMIL